MATCTRCEKSFRLFPNKVKVFEADGLCGKCRSRKKFLDYPKDRKIKPCPECGKLILEGSKLCKSCVQTGSRNRIFVDGHAARGRKCTVCGNPVTSGSSKGRCLGCYTKTLSGDGNPNFRFGHYTGDFISKAAYKDWRKRVFTRDGFKCMECGIDTHNLFAHHIFPKRTNPELVFDVGNGITLCKKHHEDTFGKELKLAQKFLDLLGQSKNP